MLRTWAVAASISGVALLALPALAAEESKRGSVGQATDNGDGIVISNPGWSSPGKPERTRTERVRRGPRRTLPEHAVPKRHFRTSDDGEQCTFTSTTRRDTPINQTEEFDNEIGRLWAEKHGIPDCTDDAGASATPTAVAEAFLRTVPLPVPAPEIAPDGQAITGLAAFLETNGTLTHAIGPEPTALGPISVEATGAYWVDWGDGSPEAGPFTVEGEVYPNGEIWHHYRWTGTYTVTLRQHWIATWSLGNDAGTIDDLMTETTVPVEVSEVQAVIRR